MSPEAVQISPVPDLKRSVEIVRRWCVHPQRWSVLAVLLVSLLSAHGQAASGYLIDVWTRENGLPNSSVTSLAQTPDGYLWIGTYNGLTRFDGVKFVSYDPENTPALRRARVRRLFVDEGGTLWINTYDGSLTSFKSGVFTLEWQDKTEYPDNWVTMISARANQPVFLLRTGELIRRKARSQTNSDPAANWDVLFPPGADAGEICVEDGEGNLWCRGRDYKLWRYRKDKFEEIPITELQGTIINVMAADARGRVWLGTDKEMAVWENSAFEVMTPTNGEPTINVTFLRPNSDGTVWTVANDRLRKSDGRSWTFEAEACRGVFTGVLERMGMHEDRSGGAWFYHYGKGLYHIRHDGRVRQLTDEAQFPGERVDCFFEDREGNLWSGVDRGGLVRLREKRFSILTADESGGKASVSVAEDRQGAVWIGTFGNGLQQWFEDKWRVFPLPGGKGAGFVFSIAPGANDRLWISAGDEDLHFRNGDRFEQVQPTVHGVKALLETSDGRLWVGTKSGLGVVMEGRFRQYRDEDGVRRVEVRALVEDNNQTLWAGAGDGTLYQIISNRPTAHRQENPADRHSIWSLHADADGTIWAGTFRGGLLRFRDGRFFAYTTQDGLPDDVICQILEDDNGRLWIGSQRGIFNVSKSQLNDFAEGKIKSLNCTTYGRYDGIPSEECSGGYQPASWRTSDGRLLFTTLKGVVAIQPDELSANRLPPPVVIETVLADGQVQAVQHSPATNGTVAAVPAGTVDVPAGKRRLEFRYTGLSFVSPDRVRFRYRLDGLDDEWTEAGTSRSVQYSYLRPGHYRFRVTACNNEGIWNEDEAVLAVDVRSYFYERPWFIALLIIGAAALVAVTARHFAVLRMRTRLEHLERQRAIERDRARIARDIHDDLGAGLTHITLLSEMTRPTAPADLQQPFSQITEVARELTTHMDEIVWAVSPENDTLDSLVTYISKFAQDYLGAAGIRCRLDVPAQLPAFALPAEARHNFFLAVKESLSNVVHHAEADEVRLRLSIARGGFTLTIEDNGRGMPDPSSPAESTRPGRVSSGHGLPNLKSRLEAIGGACVVTSLAGRGTTVEMTLPLRVNSPELASSHKPSRGIESNKNNS